MAEDTAPDTKQVVAKPAKAAKPKKSEKSAQKPSGGRVWGVLALLVSLVALGAVGYGGYIYYIKQDLFSTDVVAELNRLKSGSARNGERQAEFGKSLENFEQRLNSVKEVQDTLASAINGLAQDLGRKRDDWALAETEQLLLIANYRLQLARDVETAVAALRAADGQLQKLADPSLLPTRKLIADEITALQRLDRADIPGIALRLGSMASTLEQLPLHVERRFATAAPVTGVATTESTSLDTLQQMWRDFLGLIRIRKTTEGQKPLLPPEQDYFLRENLRLMLYGAQLAMLQGDTGTYTQNLKSARRWIGDYFDTETQVVTNMQEELQALLDEKIVVELPDVSASLGALRDIASKKLAP
ncbi:MAG: uroporphyrinogen-III C-methyltransferase [Proteobacteria bacterium]|nr:uroporphyrinogen-III C-methyltransferase [Pseudomonadota bacterium]